MPLYEYTATKKDGTKVEGQRETSDEKTLSALLKQEELLLLRAHIAGGKGSGRAMARINDFLIRFTPVKIVDKMIFARNLSVMMAAGLPISRSLAALEEQTSNPRLKKVIGDVHLAITRGRSMAEALDNHKNIFGELFISMVAVGETTGKLPFILKLLARQMKKDYDIRRRVRGAMFYPAVVVIALFIIGFLMLIYVVPSLTAVLEDLGAELPLSTRIVIFMGNAAERYAPVIAAGIIGFAILFWRALKTGKGKEISSVVMLRLPIFGKLSRKFNVARFCRTMTYLVTAGVPIVRALCISAGVLGNTRYRAAVIEAGTYIEKGRTIHETLDMYPELFDPLVRQMISVGEETGNISDMFMRLAAFFEEEISATTKNLSTIIEPILMLVVGAAVGFFAISMLQPIYGSLGNL